MEPIADTLPTLATGSKSSPLQHAFLRMMLLGSDPKAYAALCTITGEASPPDYASINMPTLLIAGAEDKGASVADCEEIYSQTGGRKRMEVVDGVGHWFCFEDPSRTAKLIGDFVEEMIR